MLNKKQFKIYFETYYKDLLGYAYTFTNSVHHSEEIVQEVFLSLWEKHKNTDSVNSIKSYLFNAVKYKSINFKTRFNNKLDSLITDDKKIEYKSSESADIVADELHILIRKGIQQLPEQCEEYFC